MDPRLYLRQWLLAMDRFEFRLRPKAGQARNAFIRSASKAYAAYGSVPNQLRAAHEAKLVDLLLTHYTAVLPYFGNLAGQQFKRRRNALERKRLTFLTQMMEWARTRALNNASTIADTDYTDVRDAIDDGLADGLGN